MNGILSGKNIVIMGVSNKWSIAWGCAQVMQSMGANIVYTYQGERLREKLMDLIGEDAQLIQCDVTKDEEIDQAFAEIKEKVGVLHGLVHSIAYSKEEDLHNPVSMTSREGYKLAQDVSAYSFIAVAKRAADLMSDGGSMVTMTHIGSDRAIPNYNVMGIAKASLESATRYLAAEMGPKNIRVNAVSPGAIKTLAAKGIRGFNDLIKASVDRTPLGRTITTEEVGKVAGFLLSDLASGVTGATLYVDGGFHICG